MADELIRNEGVSPEAAADGAAVTDTATVPAMETVPRAELDALKAAHADEIRALKAKFALSFCIAESGAKNPDLVGRLIDVTDIPFSADGEPELAAVRQKLADMKRSDGYLFAERRSGNAGNDGADTHDSGFSYVGGEEDPARMSDADYYRMYRARRRSL